MNVNTTLSRGMRYEITSQPINDQYSHHIETSQMIYFAYQMTGFYMIETFAVNQ